MEETEDETEGKIYCVLGWKELILLKCPYAQAKLQIQCKPYQNTNALFTELSK